MQFWLVIEYCQFLKHWVLINHSRGDYYSRLDSGSLKQFLNCYLVRSRHLNACLYRYVQIHVFCPARWTGWKCPAVVIRIVPCIISGQPGALPCNKIAQTWSIASALHLFCAGQTHCEDRTKKNLFALVPKYFRQGFKPIYKYLL